MSRSGLTMPMATPNYKLVLAALVGAFGLLLAQAPLRAQQSPRDELQAIAAEIRAGGLPDEMDALHRLQAFASAQLPVHPDLTPAVNEAYIRILAWENERLSQEIARYREALRNAGPAHAASFPPMMPGEGELVSTLIGTVARLDDPRAIPILLDDLETDDAAAHGLIVFSNRVVPPLFARLTAKSTGTVVCVDPGPSACLSDLHAAALRTLTQMADRGIFSALSRANRARIRGLIIATIRTGSASERQSALHGAALLADRSLEPLLRYAAASANPVTRSEAVVALGDLHDPALRPFLRKIAASDRDRTVRATARLVLLGLGGTPPFPSTQSRAPAPLRVLPARQLPRFALADGPWHVDRDYDSTVYLASESRTGSMVVAPALTFDDGVTVSLPPLHLAPQQVTTLDLAPALAVLPAGEATAWGSIRLDYRARVPGQLYAYLLIQQRGHSGLSSAFVPSLPPEHAPLSDRRRHEQQQRQRETVARTAALARGLHLPPPGAVRPFEALWSRPSPTAQGWLALSNISSVPAAADWQVFGSNGARRDGPTIHLAPHATEVLGLEQLIAQLPLAERNAGGLQVQLHPYSGRLLPLAAFTDPVTGATVQLDFQIKGWGLSPMMPRRFEMVGLPVGPQPTAFGFPPGAAFRPLLSLRNASAQPLALTLLGDLTTPGDTRPCRIHLAITLPPAAERDPDLAGALRAAGCAAPGMLSLQLDVRDRRGDLECSAHSSDETGRVEVEGTTYALLSLRSNGLGVRIWANAPAATTLLTLWNPSSRDERLRLRFAGGAGVSTPHASVLCSDCYSMLLDLQPGASRTLSTAALRAARPDASGHSFPVAAQGTLLIDIPERPGGYVSTPHVPPFLSLLVGETLVAPPPSRTATPLHP